MNDSHPQFVTWELIAIGALSVLQAIVGLIIVWALKTLLALVNKTDRISGRVAHVEGHLETNSIDEVQFKRL
jgi:hypothetical protein